MVLHQTDTKCRISVKCPHIGVILTPTSVSNWCKWWNLHQLDTDAGVKMTPKCGHLTLIRHWCRFGVTPTVNARVAYWLDVSRNLFVLIGWCPITLIFSQICTLNTLYQKTRNCRSVWQTFKWYYYVLIINKLNWKCLYEFSIFSF